MMIRILSTFIETLPCLILARFVVVVTVVMDLSQRGNAIYREVGKYSDSTNIIIYNEKYNSILSEI